MATTCDVNWLLREPVPFELDLPWGDYEFSKRFYSIVNNWGIPTEDEVRLISEYAPKPGSRILDLACGGGRHSIALAQKGFRMTGVEIGRYPVELARRRATEDMLEIDFINQDILRIGFEKRFEIVFLICGQLGHFAPGQAERIFKTAARALVDGGIFITHLFGFSEDDRCNQSYWYREKRPFYFEHISVIHHDQYYFERERIKLIRDFAVDTITRENRLFGISEKYYTKKELSDYASHCGLKLVKCFGDYAKSPLEKESPQNIYIFKK